jgi:hypothetical protein
VLNIHVNDVTRNRTNDSSIVFVPISDVKGYTAFFDDLPENIPSLIQIADSLKIKLEMVK